MKTIAAILAGGSGTRIGGEVPKQMLPLGGKPVLAHSVGAFDAHPGVDAVVVVCREDLIPAVRELAAREHWCKVRAVVPGGADRSGSSLAAIRAARLLTAEGIDRSAKEGTLTAEGIDRPAEYGAPEAVRLLIHDAARPLVDAETISRCLQALETADAVEPVVPVADTIVQVDADGILTHVPARDSLRAVQTPQGFRLDTIEEAYRRAAADLAFTATDDASVVLRYLPGVRVCTVLGSPRNRKLTLPSDLDWFESQIAL